MNSKKRDAKKQQLFDALFNSEERDAFGELFKNWWTRPGLVIEPITKQISGQTKQLQLFDF